MTDANGVDLNGLNHLTHMPKWWIACIIVAMMAGGGLSVDPCHAGEVITNETILKTINETHGVMVDQRRRIRTLMDAFLTGNLKDVRQEAEAIANSMAGASGELPPAGEMEATQLKLLANVIEQARIVRQATQGDDYQKAYLHFSAMVGLCIECHQARRPWGTFPTWEPPRQESAPPQGNQAPPPQAEGTTSPRSE